MVTPLLILYESLTNTLELKDFHFSLWAGRGQNTVCPWQFI